MRLPSIFYYDNTGELVLSSLVLRVSNQDQRFSGGGKGKKELSEVLAVYFGSLIRRSSSEVKFFSRFLATIIQSIRLSLQGPQKNPEILKVSIKISTGEDLAEGLLRVGFAKKSNDEALLEQIAQQQEIQQQGLPADEEQYVPYSIILVTANFQFIVYPFHSAKKFMIKTVC